MLTALDADALHDAWLAAVRAMPYRDYLRTDWWQRFRADALRRAGGRCQLCGGDGPLEVHHNTYARLGCERPEDVICICCDCHDLFHDVLPARE
jgi:5-methylcytosine-specific restriction endonuclease McrA